MKNMELPQALVRICFSIVAAGILSSTATAKEKYLAVDPDHVPYIFIGDEGDAAHPQGSGIYRVLLTGPIRREYKWEGVQKVQIPTTGLKAGRYVIQAFDGLGNSRIKRIRITHYVAGEPPSFEIKKSTTTARKGTKSKVLKR